MSHLVDINACVLGKYIGQILLLYCAEYALLFTGDSIGKGSLFTTARIYGFFFGVALTSVTVEFNGIRLLSLAACSQAVSNLHITSQILLTVDEITVGQLACQCIQYVSYTCIIIHSDAGVVGNQANCRACCRTLDNGVACCVVACVFTIAGMSIENVGVAAVIINGQVIAVLLEDVARSSLAFTACQLSYMAAVKCCIGFAPCFIVPGCTVGNIKINDPLIRITSCTKVFRKRNTGPGRILIRQAYIDNTVSIRIVKIRVSPFAISNCIAFNYCSNSACCILVSIHVDINNAAIRFQCIVFILLVSSNLNITAADSYGRTGSDSSQRITVFQVDINLTIYVDDRCFAAVESSILSPKTMGRSEAVICQLKVTVNIYTASIIFSQNTIGWIS